MSKTINGKPCLFNPNDYGYIQAQQMAKPYRQKRCPMCGLWTVYIHRKTKYTFSLCEGRDAVMVHLGLVRKALERMNCLTVPRLKPSKIKATYR